MESQKLIDSGYRSTKITMSFLRANTVSLIYPIPLVLLFLFGAAIAESLRLRFAPGGTGVFGTYTFSGMDNLLVFFVLYMVLLFVLIVLHELTHALFFLKGCENGWKSIKFGVKALTPYCHCKEATTVSIARRSCLAPLFSVSLPLAVISYISGSFLMYLLTVVMIFGSGADLWVFLKLRRYDGKTCYALDMENEIGMMVYEPDRAQTNPGLDTKEPDRAQTQPGIDTNEPDRAQTNPDPGTENEVSE